jgi:hypothetical protein
MKPKHRAGQVRGGSAVDSIVDIEGWAEESRLRQARSPFYRARMATWRLKCWLLRKGLVSSIS